MSQTAAVSSQSKTIGDTVITGGDVRVCKSFDEMGISDAILHGIYGYGFEKPSKIQQIAIVPMIEGRDLLAQSQSGTGKTGCFATGALSHIKGRLRKPQVIVLSPTRELAQQTEKVVTALGSHIKTSDTEEGVRVCCATGGSPVEADRRALRDGAQFIVGTPGRIFDLIRRGYLKLDDIQYLIMDEADQLLDELFLEQINQILKSGTFPMTTRLAMFSATMPEAVVEIADRYLKEPLRVLLPAEEVRLEGIKQFHIKVEREDWKFDAILDLYKHIAVNQAIIFVNKRNKADWLTESMTKEGYTVQCIHGDMDTADRKRQIDEFRAGKFRVLVSTDVLARGFDLQSISVVINYEMPTSRENYFHRIGRSGRFGRKGVAINFICGEELAMLRDIEKHYSITVPELPDDLSVLSPA